MKLDFCVSHNYIQRYLPPPPSPSLLLLRPPSLLLLHHHDSVEIPPKTRNKQKQKGNTL